VPGRYGPCPVCGKDFANHSEGELLACSANLPLGVWVSAKFADSRCTICEKLIKDHSEAEKEECANKRMK
jgi:hypothetical protein